VCIQCLFQRIEHDAFFGTGLDLDREHAQAVYQIEQAVICG